MLDWCSLSLPANRALVSSISSFEPLIQINDKSADPVATAKRQTSGPGEPLVAVWLRLFLFIIIAVLAVVPPVYLIDPFGLFSKPPIVTEFVRRTHAVGVNQVMLEVISFANRPKPN